MTPAMIALAAQLAEQGFAYWTQFQMRANNRELTQADLDEASSKLNVDLAQLEADYHAQQAAQQQLALDKPADPPAA